MSATTLKRMRARAFDLDLLRMRDPSERTGKMTVLADHCFDEDVMKSVLRLAGQETRGWNERLNRLKNDAVLSAAAGFSAPVVLNGEPVVAPGAVTGGTAEINLYGPTLYGAIPAGTLRAPQGLHVYAAGLITSSATTQTAAFTSRIGTSGTPASNQSLGATGLISLGASSAQSNMLWWTECHITMRTPGTSATAVGHTLTQIGNVAGAAATSAAGMGGNTTATFDATIAQGFALSVTPSAAGVSAQLTQLLIIAFD